MRKGIADILDSVYERDRVLISTGAGSGGEFAEAATIGHNFEAVIGDLGTRMRAAAADLDFEEAARLRDELKRLRSTELAVIDDPTAKRLSPSPRGRGEGRGEGAGGRTRNREAERDETSRIHKPALDEMGIALYHEVAPHRAGEGRRGSPRKPDLDEMGPGVESCPASAILPARARPSAAPACAAAGSRTALTGCDRETRQRPSRAMPTWR